MEGKWLRSCGGTAWDERKSGQDARKRGGAEPARLRSRERQVKRTAIDENATRRSGTLMSEENAKGRSGARY